MIFTKQLQKHDRDWKFKRDTSNPRFWVRADDFTDKEIERFVRYSIQWCEKKFGYNWNKDYRVEFDWDRNDYLLKAIGALGVYDPDENVIYLRVSGHRTIYNIANTIIHEYIHYLQPKGWYARYDTKYGYDHNPYEVEAFHLGDLYEVDCTHWVMKKMKWWYKDTPKIGVISKWDNARGMYARKGSTRSSRLK